MQIVDYVTKYLRSFLIIFLINQKTWFVTCTAIKKNTKIRTKQHLRKKHHFDVSSLFRSFDLKPLLSSLFSAWYFKADYLPCSQIESFTPFPYVTIKTKSNLIIKGLINTFW